MKNDSATIFVVSEKPDEMEFVCNGQRLLFEDYLPYARFTLASYPLNCMLAILNDFFVQESFDFEIHASNSPEREVPFNFGMNVTFPRKIGEDTKEAVKKISGEVLFHLYPFHPKSGDQSWTGFYMLGDPNDESAKHLVFNLAERFLSWLISKEYLYYRFSISKIRGQMEEIVSSREYERQPLVTVCL